MLPAGSVVAAQTIAFDYKGIDPGDGIPVRLTDGRHGYLIADADSSWGGKAEKLDGSYLLVGQPRPALLLTEQ
jgi:hypothetical protein